MVNSQPGAARIGLPLTLDVSVDNATAAGVQLEPLVLALFDEHRRPLLRYVVSLGLSPHDAEDVVQDVFVALFRHLQRGGARHHLTGWLFQVAHNLGIRHRRSRWRRSWLLQVAFPAAHTAASDAAPDPEAQLAELQRYEKWQRVLKALPERDRQCVLLRAQGFTYRRIATELDMSLGAVAKSMARALARFTRADDGRGRK